MLKNAEKIVGRNGHKNDVSKNDPHSQREDKYWYLPDDVRLSDEDYEAWEENELNSSGWSGNSNNIRKKKLLRYSREELPEDTGSAKRLMPPDYDLKNELGPNNRYDTLAGLAHEYGYKYRDPSLVAKGLRLGELISIPPPNLWTVN